MPGDIVDARLNNYFLENVFSFISGSSESLWHHSFFYPFPYVLGFSDNLFGSSPVYVLARFFAIESDSAFQIWFLVGYLLNFLAAYYALRRLNGSVVAAVVGALIFAFALPTTAHAGHAQLHYRFGLPLAIVFFAEFLNTKTFRYFLIAGAWLVWQFYAGVYIGFFTLLLLATMTLTYLGYARFKDHQSIRSVSNDFFLSWHSQSKNEKIIFISILAFLLALLLLLFYPYLQVSHLYGAKRSWNEIATMLPRPQSYFLADASFFWSNSTAGVFSSIAMRHEHQMFIGAIPFFLALMGFIIGSRSRNGATFTLMTGMLAVAIVLTLNVGGYSLWYLLHKLPLASSIRVMTRLDQAFLFPVAYLAVIGLDYFRNRYSWATKSILIFVLPMLIVEAAMTTMGTSTKDSWRQRFSTLDAIVPKELPDNSILFFAQRSGPPYADELDAMWVSMKLNKETLNGYSGLLPPEYDYEYGSDCAQIPKRVLSYLKFSNQSDNIAVYRDLMSRIVPLGFTNCDSAWLKSWPNITVSDRVYSVDEFKHLKLWGGEVFTRPNDTDQTMIRINIQNSSDQAFASGSSLGKPIRISWRFIESSGKPLSGWNNRKSLPFDIPAQGELKMQIPINVSEFHNTVAVEISLVQEGVFWGHDVGLEPAIINLRGVYKR
ncbi:MAG: hypothetical protein HWE12_10495 [Oceanospirillaceae bacterium]|nr:hypothetical protein [Oceanospirillaceae bacterium]